VLLTDAREAKRAWYEEDVVGVSTASRVYVVVYTVGYTGSEAVTEMRQVRE